MAKKFAILGLSLLLLAGCGQMDASVEKVQDSISSIQIFTGGRQPEPASEPTEREVVPQNRDESDSVPETLPPVSPNYVAFERISRDEIDPEGIHLLTENRCIAEFHSDDPELSEWVGGLLRENRQHFDSSSRNLLQYAREVIEEYGTETFYTYSNYEDQALTRHDSHVASFVTVSHVHAGGAHPNTVQTAQNLDLQQKKVLRLEDIIEPDQADRLLEMVQKSVRDKFEPLGLNALYEEAPESIARSMQYGEMTPYWYFEPDALVIFYNQYELGPYAAGIIKAEMPYEALRGVLKEEFVPHGNPNGSEEMSVTDELDGREPISVKLGDEPDQILLAVDGRIREIQISEVIWVDETPVSQRMMLSVSEMDESQVLAVTGGFVDESRSFAVEYVDGAGNRQLQYLRSDGLSDRPQH